MDLKAVFRLVDVDKSGSISRIVRLELNIKSNKFYLHQCQAQTEI